MSPRSRRTAGVVGMVTAALATSLLLLTGCTAAPTATATTAAAPILRGDWQLSSASDVSGSIDLSRTFVTFSIGDSAHTAVQTPCGRTYATVRGGLGAVFIDTFGARTLQDCIVPNQAGIDYRFMAALRKARVASLAADSLILASPNVHLEFVRVLTVGMQEAEGTTWALRDIERTLGPQEHNVPLDGYANVTFTTGGRYSLVTACDVSTGTLQANGSLYSARYGSSSPRTCRSRSISIESALGEVVYRSPFTISIRGERMVLATAGRTVILSFARVRS